LRERETNMNLTKTMLAAAVGGILVGCGGSNPPASAPSDTSGAAGATSAAPASSGAPATDATKHACKGQNACKGQGWNEAKSKLDCLGSGGTPALF
jgi:hypothetical protein